MGHGGGGRLSADLVEHLILPAFGGQSAGALGDSTVVPPIAGRLAISTDSYVVRPLFFPGGSIGELAVNGTINDLAMSGARPLYLTAGFILEEGFPLATLAEVARRMGEAARQAGVRIVAGDTKVVGKGQADGLFINTAGIGELRPGVDIGPCQARPGDVVLVSGTMGDHGMAILCAREDLEFDGQLESDCAALHELTEVMLDAGTIHVLRDPTRGGLAASLNEIARSSQVGIVLDEARVPIGEKVQSACELLGLDPLHVANEGKLVAVLAAESADAVLAAMRRHPLGRHAARIGSVTGQHPGVLAAKTSIGGTRVIPMPLGEQLPRIC
ncbi:MAG: hydrogenase expression/formation protein HypE [Bryobacteraceae bacterium]|nr:hydrogenase expression/formation protein HypE [Bryobacteraceae bacterium]